MNADERIAEFNKAVDEQISEYEQQERARLKLLKMEDEKDVRRFISKMESLAKELITYGAIMPRCCDTSNVMSDLVDGAKHLKLDLMRVQSED
jgi:hypothetical protein